jgi:hypothetical protein
MIKLILHIHVSHNFGHRSQNYTEKLHTNLEEILVIFFEQKSLIQSVVFFI